jgi:hypothetical protein
MRHATRINVCNDRGARTTRVVAVTERHILSHLLPVHTRPTRYRPLTRRRQVPAPSSIFAQALDNKRVTSDPDCRSRGALDPLRRDMAYRLQ